MTCLHCGLVRRIHYRGLCRGCWSQPAIRERYEMKPRGGLVTSPEPTDAELDALIAQQRANLPAWYLAEEERRLARGE